MASHQSSLKDKSEFKNDLFKESITFARVHDIVMLQIREKSGIAFKLISATFGVIR